tara:strand:+ start:583 stop:1527 length:945 start_codon:yes stop_codon:yes gene_type:complete
MKSENLYVYSFYRFLRIRKKKSIKNLLDNYFKTMLLRGTILIANEGINASISGREEDLFKALKLIKKLLNIKKLNIKINKTNFLPFNRMKVRLKKEIVALGQDKAIVEKFTGKHIHPKDWNKFINEKNVKLIDTRNIYEINIGQFKSAINPQTSNFREFPSKIKKANILKSDKIAMYCTGGIRCEKASAYLIKKGYKNVYQLDGGILNYLEYNKKNNLKSKWIGECFVFDNRVSIDKNLRIGKYKQCYSCRNPISQKDTKSKKYKKGVSCPNCYGKKSKIQLSRSHTRQKQIERAEKIKINHPFKKITAQEIFD